MLVLYFCVFQLLFYFPIYVQSEMVMKLYLNRSIAFNSNSNMPWLLRISIILAAPASLAYSCAYTHPSNCKSIFQIFKYLFLWKLNPLLFLTVHSNFSMFFSCYMEKYAPFVISVTYKLTRPISSSLIFQQNSNV